MRKTLLSILFVIPLIINANSYYPKHLNGLAGAQLKISLGNLINTHKRISSNTEIWKIFSECDVKSDGTIWSILDSQTPSFLSSNLLEVYEINRIFPTSYYGDTYPYKYDLSFDIHVLNPASITAIESKKDYSIGDLIKILYTNNSIKVGLSLINNIEINAYEPTSEYKGDIARMIMYGITCYSAYNWQNLALQLINGGNYPTLNKHAQELLCKWHREDPVSEKEKNRNEVIFKYQQNRNPFIDFPDLCEYLWGNKINEPFVLTDDDNSNNDNRAPLKSCYSISDKVINLYSPWIASDVKWSINGKIVSESYLIPSEVGIGKHLLEFKNNSTNGRLIISITE